MATDAKNQAVTAAQDPDDDFGLSPQELQQMLQDKTRENMELQQQLAKAEAEMSRLTTRTLRVHEENSLIKANTAIAAQRAQLEYDLEIANRFVKSGAWPKLTPEQAYTLMAAGREMGMKPAEALNSLYIVKGKIEPYSKALSTIFTRAGFTPSYHTEDKNGVLVQVVGPDGTIYREAVDVNDPILQRSEAMKISAKHKMRYHGLRLILNFHLPHLIKGCADLFEREALERQAEIILGEDSAAHSVGLSEKEADLIDRVTDLLEVLLSEGKDLAGKAAEVRQAADGRWGSIVKEWEAGKLTAESLEHHLTRKP